ncbi:hypothetical protein PHJA_000696700 [Phtheirospermum japonicum]|uniref:Uncharacterized protein n=1 Tax=Phtheirospermum japonicum TaxID=374723 RepID=A0A830BD54_9LAMI|nr:hypothetical protein PHJA_000696700 [Phtheirospermum japonicum]
MEFDLENPLPPSDEKLPSLFDIESDHMPSKTYLQSLNSEDSHLSVRCEFYIFLRLIASTLSPSYLSFAKFEINTKHIACRV